MDGTKLTLVFNNNKAVGSYAFSGNYKMYRTIVAIKLPDKQ